MKLAIVVVHYRTPELAAECVAAFRASLGSCGLEARLLLIDNGSDAAGRALLAGLPAELIEPGENLGFAGGVNLGVAKAFANFGADVAVVANPDVLVRPGCLGALIEELERGAAVAGPLFTWDRGGRMLLPPPERRTRRDELRAALARHGGRWAERARSHWRQHARRHWQAEHPLATPWLSGGLLALRREAWAAVGPFDPGYRLYFEETDWLLRLVRRGLEARLVPAARAVHLHAQSALSEPSAPEWFEASAIRFRRRWYGAGFERLLAAAGRGEAPPEALPPFPAAGLDLSALAVERPLWVEVSPAMAGFPAAAERIDRLDRMAAPWRLPAEIAERLPAGCWVVQVSDVRGREVGRWVLAGPMAGEGGEGS